MKVNYEILSNEVRKYLELGFLDNALSCYEFFNEWIERELLDLLEHNNINVDNIKNIVIEGYHSEPYEYWHLELYFKNGEHETLFKNA